MNSLTNWCVSVAESGNSSRCHDNKLSSPREQVEHLEEINRKISTDLEQMHAADREKGRLLTTVREELRLLEEDHDKVRVWWRVHA